MAEGQNSNSVMRPDLAGPSRLHPSWHLPVAEASCYTRPGAATLFRYYYSDAQSASPRR